MTKDAIMDVLFKGRFYEWWCLKEGTAVFPSKHLKIALLAVFISK